jgi:hypothetical protein
MFLRIVALAVGLALAVIGAERGMFGSHQQPVLHVLVLTESSTSTVRCPSCVTYLQQYADVLARGANKQVWIEHLSWQQREVQPAESPTARADARSGLRLRQSLGSADLIVFSVGDEHSMITLREDSCDSVGASSSPCTTSVSEFDRQLRAVLTTIDAIRSQDSRVLVVAAPDPHNRKAVPAAQLACEATLELGGICVNTTPLVARGVLSPTEWHGSVDELAMDQAGHDAVAEAVLQYADR